MRRSIDPNYQRAQRAAGEGLSVTARIADRWKPGGEVVTRTGLIALTLGAILGTAVTSGPVAAEAVKFAVDEVNFSIPESLTGRPGDSANGKKVVLNRKLGNCLDCHSMPIPDQQFHGNVGPPLYGVANRYDEGQLRLRVVNMKLVNPSTIMPTFYSADGFHRVTKEFEGKTILTAQQVEDVVAYLTTLE